MSWKRWKRECVLNPLQRLQSPCEAFIVNKRWNSKSGFWTDTRRNHDGCDRLHASMSKTVPQWMSFVITVKTNTATKACKWIVNSHVNTSQWPFDCKRRRRDSQHTALRKKKQIKRKNNAFISAYFNLKTLLICQINNYVNFNIFYYWLCNTRIWIEISLFFILPAGSEHGHK